MLHLLAALQPNIPPRCSPPRLDIISGVPDIKIDGEASKELITFDRMLKVKPYPPACPYDGIELFHSAEPLRLQPPPSRPIDAALRRLYRQKLGRGADVVLEHVCDGGSRLPSSARAEGTAQLHHCEASLATALRSNPRLEHATMPSLFLPSNGVDAPSYTLPFGDSRFDAVVSHHCVPYTVAPLPLFAELHRVLKPSGRMLVTFEAPPPLDSAARWAQHATCDPTSASLAWLQAADGADLLYMVGSFFFYSGGWSSIEVSEVLPHSPASPAPLYAVTATKLTNRAITVLRAQNDKGRVRRPPPKGGPVPEPIPPGDATVGDLAAAAAANLPLKVDPPVVPPRKGTLQEAAQQRRKADAGRARSSSSSNEQQRQPRPVAGQKVGSSARVPRGDGTDRSAEVRAKILDTIKRGIADNRGRTDLQEGERKMLEHMQLYVMETKVAETQLSAEERLLWDEMKEAYIKDAKD